MISLLVNGEGRAYTHGISCAQLLEHLGLAGQRVALECNGEIVPRGLHATRVLNEGDRIEIVVAVGGG